MQLAKPEMVVAFCSMACAASRAGVEKAALGGEGEHIDTLIARQFGDLVVQVPQGSFDGWSTRRRGRGCVHVPIVELPETSGVSVCR